MTWEIALGIFALVSFVITVVSMVTKFTGVITKLETTVGILSETVDRFRDNSHETHERLFNKLEEHGEQLVDHERRIKFMERQKGDKNESN